MKMWGSKALVSRARLVTLMAILALGLMLVGADAQAQSASVSDILSASSSLTYTSGIQIQNTSTTLNADVTITFYDAGGNVVANEPATGSFIIPAKGSCTILGSAASSVPTPVPSPGTPTSCNGTNLAMQAPTGFNGSAVVSSDQIVLAAVNLVGYSGAVNTSPVAVVDGYTGLAAGSTTVSVPDILSDYSCGANCILNTSLSIQNTNGVQITGGTIVFTPISCKSPCVPGVPITETLPTIAANATLTLAQSGDSQLGSGFFGVATINSNNTGLLAVVGNESQGTTLLVSFTGVSGAADTTVYAPLIENDNHGNYTSLTVQNTNVNQVTVSLSVDGQFQQTKSIPGFGAVTWNPTDKNNPFPAIVVANDGKTHSATVTQTAGGSGKDLLGSIQLYQFNYPPPETVEFAASQYGALPSSQSSATVSFPLVMNNNDCTHGCLFTGEVVQNVGSSTATVTFTLGNGTFDTRTIQSGASGVWACFYKDSAHPDYCQYQGLDFPKGTEVASFEAMPHVTSAVVTGTSSDGTPVKLIGIMQQSQANSLVDEQAAFDANNSP